MAGDRSAEVVSVEKPVRICLKYDGVYMGGVAEWRLEPIHPDKGHL